MPKVGMEPVRRKALVDAALKTIGHHGSLTVTMSEIAREAGVSAALAHHYFGSKDRLLIETIRSLLRQLRADAGAALSAAATPRERISAVIRISFQADQFDSQVVAAWLAFYSEAQRSEEVRRLLALYARRLHSNLMSGLRPLCGPAEASRIADGAAAMIDGLYIRQSLKAAPLSIDASVALVEDYVTGQLASHPTLEGEGRTKGPGWGEA
ncbi:TetR/AcrR family transcriptional repressor of bet genes [Rhizobium rosettiformans]|uniref:HTH-type transcriptional regulator BetI n=2 Tax=Rhizobium rosettiformans TaxID=1368430 RepID=A0A4V4HRJ0_9HYPH|nr:transcriptional regulator BetI [Rhizobium rosettiformans]MBB5274416.1 TetR/AcrR family transcriptional repressor of bet genes [Rhizobium rosettiformans]THV37966.1 transcriptional regulator BetI [Rhizobium rosettiformans W3]